MYGSPERTRRLCTEVTIKTSRIVEGDWELKLSVYRLADEVDLTTEWSSSLTDSGGTKY